MTGTRSINSPTFSATMTANVRNTANADTDTASVLQGLSLSSTFTSGTTDTKFDRFWSYEDNDLTSGGSVTIDLYDLGSLDIGGGAGNDALGQNWAIAEVVGICLSVTTTSVGSIYLGGDGTTAAFQSMFGVSGALDDTAQLVCPPGFKGAWWTTNDPAWAVTDTSNHLLKVTAVGGAANYSIAVAARSA